jgi:predicted phosphodiesterase
VIVDELWENKKFKDIRQAHSHIFWLMREFHNNKRLYQIWGNHDKKKKDPKFMEQYYDERKKKYEPLFKAIKVHEGLILKYSGTDDKIFLVHGHQGDLKSDRFWWIGMFFVRNFWKHLQLIGVKDPTSPAKNFKKREKVEKELIKWVKDKNQMLIAGHTHRPVFPLEGKPPYFNDGSCVHLRCITGIEIQKGEIELIKWLIKPDEKGRLTITREVLVGPKKLEIFLKSKNKHT